MKTLPLLFLLILVSCSSQPSDNSKKTPSKPVKPGNLEFFEVYSFQEINQKGFQINQLEKLISYSSDSTYYFVIQKNIRKVDSILAIPELKKELPKDLEFMWSLKRETFEDSLKGQYLYLIKMPKGKLARIDRRFLKGANLELHGGRHNNASISITMTLDGTAEWGKMTADNIDRPIAFTMDHKVLYCPTITCTINAGNAGIEGNFSTEELQELTDRINCRWR